jgi:hypothetical protein
LAAGTADCGNQEQNEGEFRRVAHWTDEWRRSAGNRVAIWKTPLP